MTVYDAILNWLTENNYHDRTVMMVEIDGKMTARLVNLIVFEDYVRFNDVDNGRHRVDFADPRFFETIEEVMATGRIKSWT